MNKCCVLISMENEINLFNQASSKRIKRREYKKTRKKEKILARQKERYPLIKEKKARESNQRYHTKRQIISEHKKLCAICGDTREHVLVFHHKNPKEKKFSIAGHNRSTMNLIAEIKKCMVLCNNCHNEFHYFSKNSEEIPKELLEMYVTLGIWLKDCENNE